MNWRTKKIKNRQSSYNLFCLALFISACIGLFILICLILSWGFKIEETREQQKFKVYEMLETKLKEQGKFHIVAFRETELSDETIIRGIIGEAIGEPIGGIIAVAWVLRNRLDVGMSVGFCALDREDLDHFISRQPQWKKGLTEDIWNEVKDGRITDPTRGALYFENINAFGLPSWIEQVKLTVLIGNHRFYK